MTTLLDWLCGVRRIFSSAALRLSICITTVGTIGLAGAEVESLGQMAQEPDASEWFNELQQDMAVELLNEVSSRRRLNQLFENPQLGLSGLARFGYASAVDGSVTFLVRDHVVISNSPILFGRIYDSRLREGTDVGAGWKLSLTETLELKRRKAVLRDANGNRLELLRNADELLTAEIENFRGRITDNGVRIAIGETTRVFSSCGNQWVLSSYRSTSQERIRLAYDDQCQLKRAVLPDGRGVRLKRNPEGLVSEVIGIGGELVDLAYEYGASGQLEIVRDRLATTVERYTYDDDGYLRTIAPSGQKLRRQRRVQFD
ncbi:MAG: DUF6531 domain-containing protein [Pseudomonadota bacterium]